MIWARMVDSKNKMDHKYEFQIPFLVYSSNMGSVFFGVYRKGLNLRPLRMITTSPYCADAMIILTEERLRISMAKKSFDTIMVKTFMVIAKMHFLISSKTLRCFLQKN